MASYKTSEFRKGLKVQIDGDPYLMIEMNFVKPGKGNALYKCKLKNLIRGTVLQRTYKGGDSLEAADVSEIDCTYLYNQADSYVFMDSETYEQYELNASQVDEAWKYLKDGMPCTMVLFNNNPITLTPPKPCRVGSNRNGPRHQRRHRYQRNQRLCLETGAKIIVPAFVDQGDIIKVDTRTGDYVERVRK